MAGFGELLSYDPETGIFRWKIKRKGVNPGDVTGSVNPRGYRRIQIDGTTYLAHRLAWLFTYGEWPKQLDHINGNFDDNRIANLRLATASENAWNRRKQSRTKSGFKGVYRRRYGWEATIMRDGRAIYLGKFQTAEAAHIAYCDAAKQLHGVFARVE